MTPSGGTTAQLPAGLKLQMPTFLAGRILLSVALTPLSGRSGSAGFYPSAIDARLHPILAEIWDNEHDAIFDEPQAW